MVSCLSFITSAAIFSRNSHVTTRGSFYGFYSIAWRRGTGRGGFNAIALSSIVSGFRLRCLSTERARAPRSPKVKPQSPMEEDANAFYVVRKGDIVGIYKNLSACQAQISSLVCDPSVSVYKGHSLRKETEESLALRGVKDALYSVHATDVNEDLFGTLVPCPFQEPGGLASLVHKASKKATSKKRSNEMCKVGCDATSMEQPKLPKLEDPIAAQPISSKYMTCFLEFDGASKGNPGKAGAGAILRTADGTMIARLRESLGIATNNVAEYRGLILGMKYALKRGFKQIQVQGDSKLVCMQVQDLWQTKNQNMAILCKEVKRLKEMFRSFQISHVLREFNVGADSEANLALDLQVGEVYEEAA